MITFATDLYAPVIKAFKTVANLTHPDGPTRPGDTLRYTVTYTNHGLEPATNFVADDPLPAGITYLPGTLSIPTAPAGEHAPSDLTGDDLGEYHAADRTVRFFLGTGAAAERGGTLAIGTAPGDQVQVSFEARVDPDTSEERQITDVAQAAFHASNLGAELSAVSSPATVTVIPQPGPIKTAELAVDQAETVAPDPIGYMVDDHVLIDNHGPDDATGIVLDETVPAGGIVETATADQGTCTVAGTEVTCRLPRLDSGGSAEIDIVEQVPAGAAAAGSVNDATVGAAEFDPRPGDNSDEATARQPLAPVGSSAVADLTVNAVVSAARVPLGGPVEKTITVHNAGPAAATGVDITDVLGIPARLQRVVAGAASCTAEQPLRCALANLPAGATQTIVLVLRPLRPGVMLDAVGSAALSSTQTTPTMSGRRPQT